MLLFQVACTCLLSVVVARTQGLQNHSVDAIPSTIGSTEDAGALAASILGCTNGSFAVQWVGEVFVEEAIHVTGGTSLDFTGAGPGAISDGRGGTRLFHVDEGSILHLSGLTLANGGAYPCHGEAVFVNRSTVSFGENVSFVSNSAFFGGAISAYDSVVSWDGDNTRFGQNSATVFGGAIFTSSNVSWHGDGTEFISDSALDGSGAFHASTANVSWDGEGTNFISNAGGGGGAISSGLGSTVSWNGDNTQFQNNSAAVHGGAMSASPPCPDLTLTS